MENIYYTIEVKIIFWFWDDGNSAKGIDSKDCEEIKYNENVENRQK